MLKRTPGRLLRCAELEELEALRVEVAQLRRRVRELEAEPQGLARADMTPEERNQEQVRILREALGGVG